MNSTSHSAEGFAVYESEVWIRSEIEPAVRYKIQRISLARKIELTKEIREIGRKVEFLESSNDPREQLEAAALATQIDRAYLAWGLAAVEGLHIDSAPASAMDLVEKGPLSLANEALRFVKRECGLSEQERKN